MESRQKLTKGSATSKCNKNEYLGFYTRSLFLLQEKCIERNKHIRIRYKPSLFQHVGIQSSYPGREQYFKVSVLKCSCVIHKVS